MKYLKYMILGIIGALVLVGVIYGCYWLAKIISYSIFYENMVIKTIKEVVKSESLKIVFNG